LNATDPLGNWYAAVDDGGVNVTQELENVLNLLISQGISRKIIAKTGTSILEDASKSGSGTFPIKKPLPTNQPPSTETYFGKGGPGHTTTVPLDGFCNFAFFYAGDAVEGSGALLLVVSGSIEDPIVAAGFILGGLSVTALGLFAEGGALDLGPLSCENS
jgi:hypothetical protein